MFLTCNVLHIDYLIIGKFRPQFGVLNYSISKWKLEVVSRLSVSVLKNCYVYRCRIYPTQVYGLDINKHKFFLPRWILFLLTNLFFLSWRRQKFLSVYGDTLLFLSRVFCAKLAIVVNLQAAALCTSCIVKGNKVKRQNFCLEEKLLTLE